MSATSLVLVGGGSAGHTSPLIATAAELSAQRPDLRLTAIGTARGLETTVIPAAGLDLELIPPVPMPRRLGLDLALLGPRLLRAVQATVQVLRRVEAQAVLGFGGYVSTPAYLAARRLGLPIVVHEQNTMPGLANRLAARLTGAVYTSFPDTPLPHATCIGLPMRRGITELDRAAVADQARTVFDLPVDTPVLLVSGGSQGAASINRAVLGARERLLTRGISVLHVLGPKNVGEETVRTVDPSSGAVYAPVALRGADGAGVRGGRPDAGPVRGQHGDGDRGGRAAGGLRALSRTATASRPATPRWWSRPAAACCWPTRTARRTGWRPRSRP